MRNRHVFGSKRGILSAIVDRSLERLATQREQPTRLGDPLERIFRNADVVVSYYAAKPKSDGAAPLGLFYISRWSNPQHAGEFAAIYAKSLWKRYKHVHGMSGEGREPLDDPAGFSSLEGRHEWLTEDGPVVIEVGKDTVLVTESLDQPTYEALDETFFP